MFTSTTEKKQCSSCTEVKFRPLGNRVLLKRLKAEEKLKGGLVLPDSAKEKQERAEVIACGPGKKEKSGEITPCPVKKGDIVLLEKYSGQEIKLDDTDYVIVRADDLIAVIE